jgi:hypothetical protein
MYGHCYKTAYVTMIILLLREKAYGTGIASAVIRSTINCYHRLITVRCRVGWLCRYQGNEKTERGELAFHIGILTLSKSADHRELEDFQGGPKGI